MSTWKARAQAAAEAGQDAQRQKEEAQQAERHHQMSAFLQKWLSQVLEVEVDVPTLEVEVDDVRFRVIGGMMRMEPPYHVVMVGLCPTCETQVESGPVQNIEHVGKLLQRFMPAGGHHCTPIRRG